mmetsp:Transcript_17267/g.51692  ORF Transcript_17267/g.51692 Transcript_17267/m.51692 type:complete len:1289 (+) Transcript_17267:2171-6037(+)
MGVEPPQMGGEDPTNATTPTAAESTATAACTMEPIPHRSSSGIPAPSGGPAIDIAHARDIARSSPHGSPDSEIQLNYNAPEDEARPQQVDPDVQAEDNEPLHAGNWPSNLRHCFENGRTWIEDCDDPNDDENDYYDESENDDDGGDNDEEDDEDDDTGDEGDDGEGGDDGNLESLEGGRDAVEMQAAAEKFLAGRARDNATACQDAMELDSHEGAGRDPSVAEGHQATRSELQALRASPPAVEADGQFAQTTGQPAAVSFQAAAEHRQSAPEKQQSQSDLPSDRRVLRKRPRAALDAGDKSTPAKSRNRFGAAAASAVTAAGAIPTASVAPASEAVHTFKRSSKRTRRLSRPQPSPSSVSRDSNSLSSPHPSPSKLSPTSSLPAHSPAKRSTKATSPPNAVAKLPSPNQTTRASPVDDTAAASVKLVLTGEMARALRRRGQLVLSEEACNFVARCPYVRGAHRGAPSVFRNLQCYLSRLGPQQRFRTTPTSLCYERCTHGRPGREPSTSRPPPPPLEISRLTDSETQGSSGDALRLWATENDMKRRDRLLLSLEGRGIGIRCLKVGASPDAVSLAEARRGRKKATNGAKSPWSAKAETNTASRIKHSPAPSKSLEPMHGSHRKDKRQRQQHGSEQGTDFNVTRADGIDFDDGSYSVVLTTYGLERLTVPVRVMAYWGLEMGDVKNHCNVVLPDERTMPLPIRCSPPNSSGRSSQSAWKAVVAALNLKLHDSVRIAAQAPLSSPLVLRISVLRGGPKQPPLPPLPPQGKLSPLPKGLLPLSPGVPLSQDVQPAQESKLLSPLLPLKQPAPLQPTQQSPAVQVPQPLPQSFLLPPRPPPPPEQQGSMAQSTQFTPPPPLKWLRRQRQQRLQQEQLHQQLLEHRRQQEQQRRANGRRQAPRPRPQPQPGSPRPESDGAQACHQGPEVHQSSTKPSPTGGGSVRQLRSADAGAVWRPRVRSTFTASETTPNSPEEPSSGVGDEGDDDGDIMLCPLPDNGRRSHEVCVRLCKRACELTLLQVRRDNRRALQLGLVGGLPRVHELDRMFRNGEAWQFRDFEAQQQGSHEGGDKVAAAPATYADIVQPRSQQEDQFLRYKVTMGAQANRQNFPTGTVGAALQRGIQHWLWVCPCEGEQAPIGRQVVALEDIAPGLVIGPYTGDYQTEEQVAEAEDESKVLYDGDREFMADMLDWDAATQQVFLQRGLGGMPVRSDIVVINARRTGNAMRFLNHGCSPNVKSMWVQQPSGPAQLIMYSLRHIQRGEALTLHYGQNFSLECCLCLSCLADRAGLSSL